jgi:hypothetical protein
MSVLSVRRVPRSFACYLPGTPLERCRSGDDSAGISTAVEVAWLGVARVARERDVGSTIGEVMGCWTSLGVEHEL